MSKFKESAGMNLGMILNAPYPVDTLVKKETDALIKAGFNVHLLCLRSNNEDFEAEVDRIKIIATRAFLRHLSFAKYR
ncbi:MAG TPA: hypothetical protein VIU13_09555 [Chryseolinea sp.]